MELLKVIEKVKEEEHSGGEGAGPMRMIKEDAQDIFASATVALQEGSVCIPQYKPRPYSYAYYYKLRE